jgi:hypothetical protein
VTDRLLDSAREHPAAAAWAVRVAVTLVVFAAASLVAVATGHSGWSLRLFFLGLFVGASFEALAWRRLRRRSRL